MKLDRSADTYFDGLQRDLRDAVRDLRRSQAEFAELRKLLAPDATVTQLTTFLGYAEVRQAISDKDYACQRMTALGAAISAEVALYLLLHVD